MNSTRQTSIVIVGAGAAGLAAAIFVKQLAPALDVRILDGAARPGAKILVSGGSRCNVTNAVVTDADYWGGKRTIIRRVLSRLTVGQTIAFFEALGVRLKEEPTRKLFPVTDRSRDVLNALLEAAHAAGARLESSTRVHDVTRAGEGFVLQTSRGPMDADRVVLATGGLSLPKTGSDGGGLRIAMRLGHTMVPTTPALAPLALEGAADHAEISGVAQDVELSCYDSRGATLQRIRGPLLWTHFGISGPAPLDMSRHILRSRLEGESPSLSANLLRGMTFEEAERHWVDALRTRPRASVGTVLAESIPASVGGFILRRIGSQPGRRLAELTRDERRALVHALTRFPLPVTDSRGYNYAEATAGGVSLDEIDPGTMHSRRCRGLYMIGEMLDVDGRLGGFNFQWAWSSARTAAEGIARDAA